MPWAIGQAIDSVSGVCVCVCMCACASVRLYVCLYLYLYACFVILHDYILVHISIY